MKRFYFLSTLFFTLLGASALGQTVLLDQNFESGSLPTGWSRSQSTPSRGWEFGTNTTLSSNFLNFPAHTKFVASNDDKYDNNAMTANVADRDMLITPTLNLTTLSAARLTFSVYHTGAYGSGAFVEISTDGGANWSSIYTIPGANAWQDLAIDLSPYLAYSNVKLAFIHNDGGQWADGVGVDDVKVFEPTPNDVQLVSVNVASTIVVGATPIEITVKNYGTSVLNSFDFTWAAGGNTYTDAVNGLGLAPGATKTIVHNNALISLNDGLLGLNVGLTNPNGQTDPTPFNNATTLSLNVFLGTTEKNVLIEQHTGSWCQFCPDGVVILTDITAANPDIFTIAIHNDDAMDFPDGNTVANGFVSGFPSGTVDRVLFNGRTNVGLSRGDWNPYAQLRKTEEPVVVVEADNTFDPTSRLLTVNVSAEFLTTLTGNYRLNVFISEDNVTGSGSGYNQSNAFNNTAGHPYQGAGNPIVGFNHRHVARHFMGGAWGQTGVIPNTIVPLTPYSHTFTYTLPAGWDENEISLIAVVQKFGAPASEKELLNVVRMGLNASAATPSEIVENPIGIEVVTIFHSTCGGGTDGEASVNAVGCSDCTFEWSNGQTGGYAFGLAPGTHTVTMTNTSGISVTQSVVVYGPIMLNPTVTINGSTGEARLAVTGGTPPYTYSWSNGGTTALQSNLPQGIYEVTVTDNAGCSTIQELRVGNTVGINDVASTLKFNVYPNPTAGNVTIEADLANNTHVSIQVFNTLGALVAERHLSGLVQVREVLDLSNQANGVYMVKVIANGTTGVQRLVLNR